MAGRKTGELKGGKKSGNEAIIGLTGKAESVGWAVQISLDSIAGVILRRLMIGMRSVVKSGRTRSHHVRQMGYPLY